MARNHSEDIYCALIHYDKVILTIITAKTNGGEQRCEWSDIACLLFSTES